MAKPEWGTKRICNGCGNRYYDMGRPDPTCPSCSVLYNPEALLKSVYARRPVVAAKASKKTATAPVTDAVAVAAVADLVEAGLPEEPLDVDEDGDDEIEADPEDGELDDELTIGEE